jgi:hypothetical protein
MIQDSVPWKEALLKYADWLESVRMREDVVDEDTLFKLERDVLMAWFSIRKLTDTFKLTDKTKAHLLTLDVFPNKKSVDYLNAHKVAECFDLSQSKEEKRDLVFVCNQFIHSYVLEFLWQDDKLESILVCSDRERQAKLYMLSVEETTKAFRLVATDDPRSWQMKRNPKTLQWQGTVS